jgi:hypothetical protein
MPAGYDIGASSSTSSGAQGGTVNAGDFIIGGSGGANKSSIPMWLIIGAGALVVMGLFAWMLKK